MATTCCDTMDDSRYLSSPSKDAKVKTLSKLKRQFNKLKSATGSRSSLKQADSNRSLQSVTSHSSSMSSPRTVQSVTQSPQNTGQSAHKQLIHQYSFQSTGTASSIAGGSTYWSSDHPDDDQSETLSVELDIEKNVLTFNTDSAKSTFNTGSAKSTFNTGSAKSTNVVMDTSDQTLREYSTGEDIVSCQVELTLLSGCNLVARDRNGLSDPYIKVKYRSKTIYKTKVSYKSLNPSWNETVTLIIPDITEPLNLRVFDKDRLSGDDFMGSTKIHLSTLTKDSTTDMKLDLIPDSSDEDEQLGQLIVRCLVKSDNNQLVRPYASQAEVKSLINIIRADREAAGVSEWDYTACIVLVEGSQLLAMDDNGFSDPYVRFKLQGDKYKTKVKNKTLNPRWMEAFSMRLYEGKSWVLDIAVFDHDIAGRADFMGRTSLDLQNLDIDKTHDLTVKLEDEAGTLRLLVTITGAVSSADQEVSLTKRSEIQQHYGLFNSLSKLKDVGWLQLKIIRAHNLSSKDFGGKSDPFCTVELVNTMLQSQTAYSTLNPEWNRVFTLPVKDIHSVLEITVYDEDKDMKKEFIGKIAIPLIMVESGVQKWYGLKDKKLFNRVKGEILLELDVIFNHFKAAVRTFNPREEQIIQDEPKFKVSLFKRNLSRVRAILSGINEARNFWQSLVDWETPSRTVIAFLAFLVAVWNFELYMLPLTLIILFLWNLIVLEIRGGVRDNITKFESEADDEDMDEGNEDKESRRSLSEIIDMVRSTGCTIQEGLGQVADFGESVRNSVNWTVPWLSTLAVVALSMITFILFMIPLRYIVLLWGVNKFTKKLRKPNYIPNNEVLDYLSRVPSDVNKMMYEIIEPDMAEDACDSLNNNHESSLRRRRR